MKKLFGRDKPKRATDEAPPLPFKHPYLTASSPPPRASVGILRNLDPHREDFPSRASSDDGTRQDESSIRDDKGRNPSGERKEQAELTRIIGAAMPSVTLSLVVLTMSKLTCLRPL